MNGGFIRRSWPPIQTAEYFPKASGLIWRFHSVVRPPIKTVVSPILVKPMEKPRVFSNGDLRAKTSTQGACADVSEQQRETKNKTHKHTTT